MPPIRIDVANSGDVLRGRRRCPARARLTGSPPNILSAGWIVRDDPPLLLLKLDQFFRDKPPRLHRFQVTLPTQPAHHRMSDGLGNLRSIPSNRSAGIHCRSFRSVTTQIEL